MNNNYSQLFDFFNKRKVLITGHTGFKGSWLSLWLGTMGAKISGISLEPETEPNLFSLARVADVMANHSIIDIRDQKALHEILKITAPEIVFHLAAQPLVRRSYEMPLETFATNVQGTANLLESIRSVPSVRVVIIITTDKVYDNREWTHPYRETDRLGGKDPYSASKACAELIADCYRNVFLNPQLNDVTVATARAGNVIGGGDWSQDRLLPDIIRAWQADRTVTVRNPNSVRPWQHVLEPLEGYLRLADKLWSDPAYAGAWNFGPDVHETVTVRKVTEIARTTYGKGKIEWGNLNKKDHHEAGWLALDNSKARHELGVSPRWTLKKTVQRTIAWYRNLSTGKDARGLCEADFKDYMESE